MFGYFMLSVSVKSCSGRLCRAADAVLHGTSYSDFLSQYAGLPGEVVELFVKATDGYWGFSMFPRIGYKTIIKDYYLNKKQLLRPRTISQALSAS